jgi:hypothetical protein
VAHGSRRARGKPQGDELAEHQVGEFPEHFSLGLVNLLNADTAALYRTRTSKRQLSNTLRPMATSFLRFTATGGPGPIRTVQHSDNWSRTLAPGSMAV